MKLRKIQLRPRDVFQKLIQTKEFYFCLVIIIINLVFTRQILQDNAAALFSIVAPVELAVEGLGIALLVCARRKHLPLEKTFLIIAIFLGGLFLIFLPPGQSPDEIAHFRRAYGISQGTLIATAEVNEQGAIGSAIPVETYSIVSNPEPGFYHKAIKWVIEPRSGEVSNQPYTNTALYNFICYIPQVIGALLGRLLNLSVLGIAYLMAICNFLSWLILVYFAIKLTPKFKTFILFISLLPITIQEATSLAPDALAIALGIFIVAMILYLNYSKTPQLSKQELLILYISALVIGFCKIVYVPLIALYILIPQERFGSKRKKLLHLGIIFGLTIVANLSWLAVSSGLLIEFNPGVNPSAQLSGIIHNPIKYMLTIVRTINQHGQSWMLNMLGLCLGAFRFYLPNSLFLVSFSIFIVLLFQRDETIKLELPGRLIFALVFLSIAALIFTSLYIQWTAAGAPVIDGIQGRYFIPILPLLPVIFARNKNKEHHATLIGQNTILYYSLFLNILACVTFFAQNI